MAMFFHTKYRQPPPKKQYKNRLPKFLVIDSHVRDFFPFKINYDSVRKSPARSNPDSAVIGTDPESTADTAAELPKIPPSVEAVKRSNNTATVARATSLVTTSAGPKVTMVTTPKVTIKAPPVTMATLRPSPPVTMATLRPSPPVTMATLRPSPTRQFLYKNCDPYYEVFGRHGYHDNNDRSSGYHDNRHGRQHQPRKAYSDHVFRWTYDCSSSNHGNSSKKQESLDHSNHSNHGNTCNHGYLEQDETNKTIKRSVSELCKPRYKSKANLKPSKSCYHDNNNKSCTACNKHTFSCRSNSTKHTYNPGNTCNHSKLEIIPQKLYLLETFISCHGNNTSCHGNNTSCHGNNIAHTVSVPSATPAGSPHLLLDSSKCAKFRITFKELTSATERIYRIHSLKASRNPKESIWIPSRAVLVED